MKVSIKDLAVQSLDIGSKGIEIDVRENKKDSKSSHIGDLFVTMTKLIWCKGKTEKPNGVSFTWAQFMDIVEHKDDVLKLLRRLKKASTKT